jgi:hypothetical protein
MSLVQLYVDEDAAERVVVEGLRHAGLNVLTAVEAGARGKSDEAQLRFAASQGRALYTLNVAHFFRLHSNYLATGQHHAGIIVIPRQRYGASEKMRRLLAFLQTETAEQLADKMVFL